jgi:hypothetical protein
MNSESEFEARRARRNYSVVDALAAPAALKTTVQKSPFNFLLRALRVSNPSSGLSAMVRAPWAPVSLLLVCASSLSRSALASAAGRAQPANGRFYNKAAIQHRRLIDVISRS